MTDKQPQDLAQRIMAALARTDEPKPCPNGAIEVDDFKELGQVPMHLRHLKNLVDEIVEEHNADPEKDLGLQHAIVSKLFWTALKEHYAKEDGVDTVEVYGDWELAGYSSPEPESSSGFPGIAGMIVIGGRPPWLDED